MVNELGLGGLMEILSWVNAGSIGVARVVTIVVFALVSCDVSSAPKAKQIDFWNDREDQSLLEVDHSKWNGLLKKYVVTGHSSGVNRFDYASVSAFDRGELNAYLAYMEQMDPRQLNIGNQKAFWLNLFNASLVQQVLKSEPENSIKDISSRTLWRKKRHSIAMQRISLDDIEHGILRPIFKDPRVHFSMVAGAIGSGNILNQAYTGANIESLLEQNTKDYLTHSRGLSFDGKRLVLSSIFKWYESDFGNDFEEVKSFILPYVSDRVAKLLEGTGNAKYDYNWALNKL